MASGGRRSARAIMRTVTVSRRTILGAGLAFAGAIVAGCSRTAQTVRGQSPAPQTAPPTRTSAVPPTPESATPASSHASGRASTSTPSGPAVEFASGPGTRNEVALTFHGAGDPAIARQLLAIFAAHHAKVTVLAVGTWLEAVPAIAREILAGGHELGNHTYSHLDIDSLDAKTAQAEIVRCRDLLVSQVGSGGQLFRQSQSQHATPLIRQLAGAAGYPVCLSYDVDSLDYTDPGAGAVRRNVAAARAGSIVSMHFGHQGTVDAMPLVLGDLAARGLQPVTATALLRS